MEIVANVPPEECLRRAAAYMVGEAGCTIEHSNPYSVTFGHKPSIGGGTAATGALLDTFSKGNAMGATNAMVTAALVVHKTTLVALPDDEGARLTLGGAAELAALLYQWVRQDLLNFSTEVLAEVSGFNGKQKLIFYSDRLELSGQTNMDTVMLDKLEGISVDEGWMNSTLTVHSREGKVLALEKMDGRKAQKFKTAVEERMGFSFD